MSVIASRYARAFASVVESKKLDALAAQQQIRDFAGTYAGSHDLQEVLNDPSIPMAKKFMVIEAIAGRIGMFQEVRNFVAVITEHEHLHELGDILTAYDEVADEAVGIVEAEIVSAHPMAPEDRTALEFEISKMVVSRVRATYTEDASLLGGAVVKIGSTIYDGSVKAQFAQLKQKLVNA